MKGSMQWIVGHILSLLYHTFFFAIQTSSQLEQSLFEINYFPQQQTFWIINNIHEIMTNGYTNNVRPLTFIWFLLTVQIGE